MLLEPIIVNFKPSSEAIIRNELDEAGIDESFIDGLDSAITITRMAVKLANGKYEYPVHKALGWDIPKKPSVYNPYAILFKQEDGSIWQAKIFEEKEGRTGYYRAPKDIGDVPYLPPIPIEIRKLIGERYNIKVPEKGSFWEWFKTSKLNTVLTEGGKKSLAALSQGFPAISLYGCQCGITKDKLIKPNLYPYTKEKTIYIALDQDENKGKNDTYLTVETVKCCINNLATCLTKGDSNVKICTWDKGYGKGLDDAHEFIEQIIDTAIKFKAWLRDYTIDKTGFIHEKLCNFFKALFGNQYLYDIDNGEWFWFNKLNWENITVEKLRAKIAGWLKKFQLPLTTGKSITSFIETLSIFFSNKIKVEWGQDSHLINFSNGVYNLKTRELLKHSHDYRFLSCLPHNYQELPLKFNLFSQLKEQCPTFWEWANYVTNCDEKKIYKILAFCNGVLTNKFYKLKKFIFVKGKRDTGKSIFLNLLRGLVGCENSASSNIQTLVKDRGNELKRIINKQLVTFPDEDKQLNGHSTLKTLTGHTDGISFRGIYSRGQDQYFKGTLAIASNYHIFLGDTTGIDRRISFLSLERQIPEELQDTDLDEKLEKELGYLSSLVLELPSDVVTEFIQNRKRGYIPELKSTQWSSKCESDSIAAWINESVIFDSNSETQIGKVTYTDASSYAYANYAKWYADNYGHDFGKTGLIKFSQKVEEICQDLGLAVKKHRTAKMTVLQGMRLREFHNETPFYGELIIYEAVNTSIPIELIEFDRTQKTKNLKPLPDKSGVKYVKDAELKQKTPEKPPEEKPPKFKIDKRPTSAEVKEKGFQFCHEHYWKPESEYMKVEHELITLLLSEFKARADQWTNYMTLRNEIKDIKWMLTEYKLV